MRAILLAVILSVWFSVAPGGQDLPWHCGYASYYAPGVMERVTATRQPCDNCVGSVATVNRALLGQDVWVWHDGDGLTGPYRVVDVAQREHVRGLVERGRVFEVGYDVAERWGMRGPAWACITTYDET